ncbi:MAG: GxxExxY protein [Bacteroidetes bacterium]|nr:GxxExxY protein [Bacteroidota bacterium]
MKSSEPNPVNNLTERIIGCAITVHRKLGPGFLESVYQAALAHELAKVGIPFEREKGLSVRYEDVFLDVGFRCDFLVDSRVIVECKAVSALTEIDEAQLINYLKVTDLQFGLLINFNVKVLKNGIKRMINGYIDE